MGSFSKGAKLNKQPRFNAVFVIPAHGPRAFSFLATARVRAVRAVRASLLRALRLLVRPAAADSPSYDMK